MSLSVSADIPADTDLLGKVVGDLQKDIIVGANAIGGTLLYVDDYTGFSDDPEEQEGNYLALQATAIDGATITVHTPDDDIVLESDGILIYRVATNAQTITFEASKDGVSETKSLNLISLVLEEDE